ncbi:MAG: SDR family NAD(P)-dependent oxidoreductase, partial [Verrucomicrobia bacterium]|nr:SDR family NAD(P)-dependent oxidoreductase [Verrucomicrobiota bacterium]
MLINNAAGPPPGHFRHVTCEDWISAIDASMLTAIFLIRALVDGMIARGFGRIISITTGGVKSPGIYLQLGVSIGVRSGLTGFFGVLSRQVARHNVTQDASKRIGYARQEERRRKRRRR